VFWILLNISKFRTPRFTDEAEKPTPQGWVQGRGGNPAGQRWIPTMGWGCHWWWTWWRCEARVGAEMWWGDQVRCSAGQQAWSWLWPGQNSVQVPARNLTEWIGGCLWIFFLISKSLGAVHFVAWFQWILRRRLQSCNYNSCCGCSFHWVFDVINCCWFWKMVLCQFGISGLFAWSGRICCSNAEYRWAFLRLGFSCGDATWHDSGLGCAVEWMCLIWSLFLVREAAWVPRAGSDWSFC
jgi:hypothetical protein